MHDKYAIINNDLITFVPFTAEMCDDTAPTMEQALAIVMDMIASGYERVSIVQFVNVKGKMLAKGKEVMFEISGHTDILQQA